MEIIILIIVGIVGVTCVAIGLRGLIKDGDKGYDADNLK